jgi:pyruvate kinase
MARIPVIVATQMMETMITSLTLQSWGERRCNHVDGADAVMLSGETAAATLYKLFKNVKLLKR